MERKILESTNGNGSAKHHIRTSVFHKKRLTTIMCRLVNSREVDDSKKKITKNVKRSKDNWFLFGGKVKYVESSRIWVYLVFICVLSASQSTQSCEINTSFVARRSTTCPIRSLRYVVFLAIFYPLAFPPFFRVRQTRLFSLYTFRCTARNNAYDKIHFLTIKKHWKSPTHGPAWHLPLLKSPRARN